ncbi:MAG: 3-hydroxyacyl-CoA dehydrogenase family protein [Dehalococcoidia bacterium]|nr:3-hydroxyacyl-CoA dehydrogenase family protein [Dehalococcoidia bacterium]
MVEKEIKQVAVIGAGLMGAGVAAEFARFGYSVTMYNTRKETSRRALEQAEEALDLMAETKLITSRQADAAYKRLHPTTNLEEAAKGADFVHESVLELLTLKQDVFSKLDKICPPPTILATNTSGLRVTDIASATKHPERVIATHYFQPPQFVPLVEVVPTQKTAPEVTARTVKLLRGLRKKVVLIPKEVPAFIGNRIQGAIGREIQSLVDNGVATPEMIDDVIQFGFGRRMAYTGYFRRLDLIGLDFLYNASKGHGIEPWKPITEHVERGELGMETGRGFYEWPGDTAKQLHRRQNTELIRLLKQDMEAGEI